jgi:hypothetical protein
VCRELNLSDSSRSRKIRFQLTPLITQQRNPRIEIVSLHALTECSDIQRDDPGEQSRHGKNDDDRARQPRPRERSSSIDELIVGVRTPKSEASGKSSCNGGTCPLPRGHVPTRPWSGTRPG